VIQPFNSEDIYIALLRQLLLRSALDPSTAKKNSFRARIEYVKMDPGEQSQCQWKPVPPRRHGDD